MEDGDNDQDNDLTDAEKTVWNCVAKHPPEENPLTEIVLGFMLRLSRMEFWQNAQVIVVQINNIFNIVTGHRTDKNCLYFIFHGCSTQKYTNWYKLSEHFNSSHSLYHPGHPCHLFALLGGIMEHEGISHVAPKVPAATWVDQGVFDLRKHQDDVIVFC